MAQTLLAPPVRVLEHNFSIGICVSDHASKLETLLDTITRESLPLGFKLYSIVVVGSGLDEHSLATLRKLRSSAPNFILIEESERRGKAEAINRIIDVFKGEFLVLVNSDAGPSPGAISTLLSIVGKDSRVGLVSASPIVNQKSGITGAVLELMWRAHNECLLTLNQANDVNHCCDELIVARADALRKLPEDTVNDGAFLAGEAFRNGYSIEFCESAQVKIDVPDRLTDVLMQRRRILYGHFQIRRRVGESPRTVELMLVDRPLLSMSILTATLSKSPRLILALPIAIIVEGISFALAIGDTVTSKAKHVPWRRFGGKS